MNQAIHPIMLQAIAPFDPGGAIAKAMAVVDNNRPSTPLIKQGSGGYLPCTSFRGDTIDVTFMGFDLVVETDYMGHVEGVMNAANGEPCMCMFQPWALDAIKVLANAEQLARSAPDADEPLIGEPDGSGV